MLIEKRLEAILKEAQKEGSLTFEQAILLTGCSKDTIRRDFIKLSKMNLVTRIRGGILCRDTSIFAYDKGIVGETNRKCFQSINSGNIKNYDKKLAIAERAATKVCENGTIVLDSGTTPMLMINHIQKQDNLIILTNGIRIANELLHRPDIHTVLLGGDLNTESVNVVGPDSLAMIKNYYIDTLFLGAAAISITKGLMSPYSMEAMLKKEMISSAGEVILLVDSTKIDKFAFFNFGQITDITTLITDDGISSSIVKELEMLGVNVEIVEITRKHRSETKTI